MNTLIRKLEKRPFLYIAGLFLIYLIFFMLLEKLDPPAKAVFDTRIDYLIPFCKYWIVPYCLWHPQLVVIILFLYFRRNSGEFIRCSLALFSCMMSALVIFVVFPTATELRPDPVPGHDLFSGWVRALYAFDTTKNACPSLHVAVALLMAVIWMRNLPKKLWPLPVLVNAAIIVSILFVKQHNLIDLAGGLVYGALFAFLFLRRPS